MRRLFRPVPLTVAACVAALSVGACAYNESLGRNHPLVTALTEYLLAQALETFYQLREDKHLRPDWQVAWAPKDDGLIILTDRDGWLHLYHQRAAGQAPRQITSGRWRIRSHLTAFTGTPGPAHGAE